MKFLTLTVLAVAVAMASATCPNLCNGHGTCGESDRCTCFGNWQGADCSERVCPFGLAWVDAPTADNTAHWYAECSNKGVCDRSTGLCQCHEGYTGKGCRRSTCPNDCSGHGTCYYIEELVSLGSKFIVDYDATRHAYTNWDVSKIQGCVCDPYYEGTDCSLRQCPRGDNILTLGDENTVQKISISDGSNGNDPAGEITITFIDLYGGVWETTPITIDGAANGNDAGRIADALKALPNQVIEDVTVTDDAVVDGFGFNVEFKSFHNAGVQNALKVNYKGCTRAGCTPMYDGLTSGTIEDALAVAVADVTTTVKCSGVTGGCFKEAAVCSEHGLCDSETGLCQCFSGYYDEDCSAQTVLV